MRLLLAAAAIAAVPSLSSAAVMVARFEGAVGGIHSTFSGRFGHPPLHVFTGPFVAEVIYDTEAGAPLVAPAGAERRNAASIVSAWIEWSGQRLDLPSAEYGAVTAAPNGFNFVAQHYVPDTIFDSLTLSAVFSGATGDLETPAGAVAATGGGHAQAYSTFQGVFGADLDGDCNFASCQGMALQVSRFTLSEYVAPSSGTPEPAAWGLMILGFGLAGAAMRRSAFA
jgi:hypothetical protein